MLLYLKERKLPSTRKGMVKVTQREIAEKVGLDVSSVNKILHQKGLSLFSQKTIEKVLETARQVGYDFSTLRHAHQRRSPRKSVSVRVQISLHLRDGSLYDKGEATIKDLSLGGALLGDVSLSKRSYPIDPFFLSLQILQGPLKGVTLQGEIVRFELNGEMAPGIRFTRLDEKTRLRISKLIA